MVPGEILNYDKMDGIRHPGVISFKETKLPIHGGNFTNNLSGIAVQLKRIMSQI